MDYNPNTYTIPSHIGQSFQEDMVLNTLSDSDNIVENTLIPYNNIFRNGRRIN